MVACRTVSRLHDRHFSVGARSRGHRTTRLSILGETLKKDASPRPIAKSTVYIRLYVCNPLLCSNYLPLGAHNFPFEIAFKRWQIAKNFALRGNANFCVDLLSVQHLALMPKYFQNCAHK